LLPVGATGRERGPATRPRPGWSHRAPFRSTLTRSRERNSTPPARLPRDVVGRRWSHLLVATPRARHVLTARLCKLEEQVSSSGAPTRSGHPTTITSSPQRDGRCRRSCSRPEPGEPVRASQKFGWPPSTTRHTVASAWIRHRLPPVPGLILRLCCRSPAANVHVLEVPAARESKSSGGLGRNRMRQEVVSATHHRPHDGALAQREGCLRWRSEVGWSAQFFTYQRDHTTAVAGPNMDGVRAR
jgi:hypothetical protein